MMPTHIRQEVEKLNASKRHQRMMFSQEFIDFHMNIVELNKLRLGTCFQISHQNFLGYFSAESASKIHLESFSIEDRLSDSGTVATKYDKWIVDELLSLSASFLTNIGFWLSRQPRKIMVGLSSEHANWHGLGSG